MWQTNMLLQFYLLVRNKSWDIPTLYTAFLYFSLQKSGKYNISNSFIFIKVPGADTATIAAISTAALTNGGRLCGRALASATGLLTNAASIAVGTVCGKSAMYIVW